MNDCEVTPNEQRVKFVNIAQNMKNHPDYKENYSDNTDTHTRNIAFDEMFNQVIGNSESMNLIYIVPIQRTKDLQQRCRMQLKEF